MNARTRIVVTAVAMVLSGSAVVGAAPTGVQWTPDGLRILVNKDVGAERWAITWNLSDVSTTGNVFFQDDRAPSFIWCENTGHDFVGSIGELDLQFRCFGSDAAFGGFHFADWSLISDSVFLPASFFIPPAETCDLTDAVNGPNAGSASSFWQCSGNGGRFDFEVFSNGTAISSATGSFDYDVIAEACTIARLDDGSFLDVEYSPSRDHLTLYEIPSAVDQVIVSECDRQSL
jgi:hypothetical protein